MTTSRTRWALQRAPALIALSLLVVEAALFLWVGALREYWESTPSAIVPVVLLAAPSFVLSGRWWPLGFASGLLALPAAVVGFWYGLFVSHEIPAAQRALRAAASLCDRKERTPGCVYDICPPDAPYAIECGAGARGHRVLVYGPSFDLEWVIGDDGRPRRP